MLDERQRRLARNLAIALVLAGCSAAQYAAVSKAATFRVLRSAVMEGRLTHPNDRELNEHVANAVMHHKPRGWRLERPDRSTPVDGAVALAMLIDRLEQRQPAPKLSVGFRIAQCRGNRSFGSRSLCSLAWLSVSRSRSC